MVHSHPSVCYIFTHLGLFLTARDQGNQIHLVGQYMRAFATKLFPILSEWLHFYGLNYRVCHPIIHIGFLAQFQGLPPAYGPLLQLATAQAGPGRGTPKTKHDEISRTMGWETLYHYAAFALALTRWRMETIKDIERPSKTKECNMRPKQQVSGLTSSSFKNSSYSG